MSLNKKGDCVGSMLPTQYLAKGFNPRLRNAQGATNSPGHADYVRTVAIEAGKPSVPLLIAHRLNV